MEQMEEMSKAQPVELREELEQEEEEVEQEEVEQGLSQ